ncbi:MAG TPA: ABC transporter permease [Dictyobacter sp.]|jgi:ABC-type transport system involved in multi-copper enzyme maturation permease subunit|nr:ABC transporter permease [Dictyobacter sp.]
MTFFALLTKELRLSLRRERTVWLIVAYILLLSFLGGLVVVESDVSSTNVGTISWSSTGIILYTVLLLVQLFLILFITPAFTSTAINGEKERQTFDLLLCSHLSPSTLIIGKLIAGLLNTLLLIAASIPLFSLVFFFGGVSPVETLEAFTIYFFTAITISMVGLFFSIIITRPAISTAITYMSVLLWLVLPLIITILVTVIGPHNGISTVGTTTGTPNTPPPPQWYLSGSPITGLLSTYSNSLWNPENYTLGAMSFAPWEFYLGLCIIVTGLLFLSSLILLQPATMYRSTRKSFTTMKKAETGATLLT